MRMVPTWWAPSRAFARTSAARSGGRAVVVEGGEAVAHEPALEGGVGADDRLGVGGREAQRDREAGLAEGVAGGRREGQAAVGVGELLGVVLEAVAAGAVLQEEAGQAHLRDAVLPQEGGREAEGAGQVAQRRSRAWVPRRYGGRPTCLRRTGSAIRRRPSGARERARKTAESGPERCAGLAIGGTTGQKATLARRSASWVASAGTRRRRT